MTPPWVVGVIGAGDMGATHLSALRRLGVASAIYSPSGSGRALAGEQGARFCATIDELMDVSTVVDICSPTDTHRPLAERAFAAGCDVICEKPLALESSDARAIIEAAEASGRALFVAQVVRYFLAYATARTAVVDGRVGAVRELALSRTGPAPRSAWFHDVERSGGVLTDLMIHDVDFARWVLGEVASVEAGIVTDGIEVRAHATLRHTGGGVSHLTGGWQSSDRHFATSMSIAGDSGMLRHSSGAALEWIEAGGRPRELVSAAEISADLPYDTQLADFLEARTTGRDARVHTADGLAAVALTRAARHAAATGDTVSL